MSPRLHEPMGSRTIVACAATYGLDGRFAGPDFDEALLADLR